MDLTRPAEHVALDLLVRELPEPQREEVRDEFLAFLRAYYIHKGAPLPEWLREHPAGE